jgi:hypothetical protein
MERLDEVHVQSEEMDGLEHELVLTLVNEESGRVYYQLDGKRVFSDGAVLMFESVRCSEGDVDELIHLRLMLVWKPPPPSLGDDTWRKACRDPEYTIRLEPRSEKTHFRVKTTTLGITTRPWQDYEQLDEPTG